MVGCAVGDRASEFSASLQVDQRTARSVEGRAALDEAAMSISGFVLAIENAPFWMDTERSA